MFAASPRVSSTATITAVLLLLEVKYLTYGQKVLTSEPVCTSFACFLHIGEKQRHDMTDRHYDNVSILDIAHAITKMHI